MEVKCHAIIICMSLDTAVILFTLYMQHCQAAGSDCFWYVLVACRVQGHNSRGESLTLSQAIGVFSRMKVNAKSSHH